MASKPFLDRAAILLSASCILHCVALPVMAISLPLLASAGEAEWVHWLLTFFAILASVTVIASSADSRRPSFLIPASLGLILIGFSVFAESFGVDETAPTVIGGCLLASAHLYRLFQAN